MTDLIRHADQNIRYFVLIRIFAKRVFLPLTAIYFIDTAGLTIKDIGLLSAYFSAIQLVAQVPTGYFADRVGRIRSLQIGAVMAGIAISLYILFQNKMGIYIGVGIEALAYAFMGGAGEALIHDSLIAKKQVEKYTKIMSQTMSISLIANSVLVALASLTYSIDPRYPFMLGVGAYILLYLATLKLRDIYPPKPKLVSIKLPNFSFFKNHKSMLTFALTFGLVSALYFAPNDMLNLALRDYGIRPEHLGLIYGLGSLVGAAVGPFYHYLRALRPSQYVLLDSVVLLSVLLAATTESAYLLAAMMIIAVSFWRYRMIIYQSYILDIYPNSYKATLISSLKSLDMLNSIWIPVVLTYVIAESSLVVGFATTTLATLCIIPIFYLSGRRFLSRSGIN